MKDENRTTQRTWTQIGREYVPTDKERREITAAIKRLTWRDVAERRQEGAMQAMGISEAIKQLRLPKVSHYAADGCVFGSYGLYGIRAHYSNGSAEVYVLDYGTGLMPVVTDFHPVEVSA